MKLNRRSFSDKVTKLIPRLRRYALVLCQSKSDAEDLLQTTLERALSKKKQWQKNTHLDRWMFTIMSSQWKNECRHNKVKRGNGLDNNVQEIIDSHSINPETAAERTFLHNQVFKEVMALPENHREAILFVYIEGMKYQDAADILSIPLGTLMSRLARARIILADKFTEGGFENSFDNNSDSSVTVIKFNKHRG
ncbi:MAG: RNA polymerase sigma factor [Cocleimonas sp.]